MKSASELNLDFKNARSSLKHMAKIQAYRNIIKDLLEIENVAAKDFSFPLIEIRETQKLLEKIEIALHLAEHHAAKFGWQ